MMENGQKKGKAFEGKAHTKITISCRLEKKNWKTRKKRQVIGGLVKSLLKSQAGNVTKFVQLARPKNRPRMANLQVLKL